MVMAHGEIWNLLSSCTSKTHETCSPTLGAEIVMGLVLMRMTEGTLRERLCYCAGHTPGMFLGLHAPNHHYSKDTCPEVAHRVRAGLCPSDGDSAKNCGGDCGASNTPNSFA